MKDVREVGKLGAKVKNLRRREELSQAQLAERLGISASYLNLIESNRRPLTAPLLIKLAQMYQLDLQTFAADDDARLQTDLLEVFGDPLFEDHGLMSTDVRELVQNAPGAARAVLALFRAYQGSKKDAEALASRVYGEEIEDVERSHLPSEEVTEVLQSHMNHFPALEEAAEQLWRDASLDRDDMHRGLARWLESQHGVSVKMVRSDDAQSVLRRYDPEHKVLRLSEFLAPRSRNFQLAHQIGLLTLGETLERHGTDKRLTTGESRALMRVALANYFAGAVLMPYQPFLDAAKAERYDIERLGHRFRTSFEQVCQRLTTMRRPGAEGVPFHMLRIDIAGNISKRFSASGIHFARFSGACPRWNIFQAFMTPQMIRVQISEMPDGTTYFCLARTLSKSRGGYHAQQAVQAIGLGCRLEHAGELVYADGVDLTNPQPRVNVSVACRLCERADCEQRAFPSLRNPLRVDENQRTVSFFDASARQG